eukprot:15432229-Alexandrium_andersonii.AAC.1
MLRTFDTSRLRNFETLNIRKSALGLSCGPSSWAFGAMLLEESGSGDDSGGSWAARADVFLI